MADPSMTREEEDRLLASFMRAYLSILFGNRIFLPPKAIQIAMRDDVHVEFEETNLGIVLTLKSEDGKELHGKDPHAP